MKHDIIERIIDRLDEYEGNSYYGCDLASYLFEGERVDGSATYSTYKAKEWIKEYFEDIGEVYNELCFNFDSDYLSKFNPFENPELFMVLIIDESASYLLGKCKLIEDNWNDEFELTEDNIKTIKNQLLELDNDLGIYETY